MKSIRFHSFLLLLSCFFMQPFAVQAQQTKILTAEKHNEYGLIYTLPTTAFDIEVTATREIRKAGPYYQYAKKYTGTDKVVTKDQEIWTISNITVHPYGVPDPSQRYLMQLKSGSNTFIAVDNDNMLRAINIEPEDVTITDFSVETAGDGTFSGREYLKYVGEDFISAQSSAKQAEMLADELMEVRDSKISLTRGTADTMPTDGRQLELMLNSLDNQEAALMAAFTGTVEKTQVIRHYSFVPTGNDKKILFRLSDFSGFVGADDYSGEPIYIETKVTARGELPVDSKGEVKKLPKDAVVYCVPGAAQLTLSFMGSELFSKEFEMSQLGVIFGLSPDIFTNKKEPSYAIFDPATGAVKEIGNAKN